MTHQILEESDNTPSPAPHRVTGQARRSSPVVRVIRVLLVEDNVGDAELLKQYLELAPAHLRFEVECVNRLLDGQARLSKKRFDVAVVDLTLPDSRGLATFQRLRDQSPDTPMVVLSNDGNEEIALQAVQQGAEDYLIKGSVSPNLLIRSLRYASERSRRRAAERVIKVTDAKMLGARKLQQKLFPAKAPQLPHVQLGGTTVAYDLSGASFPADTMGGDYFDYIPMMKGTLGLVVGDVSGHGFGPALLMVETRAYLRSLAHTFDDVGAILAMTNRVLLADVEDQFVTLFYGQLDILSGKLTYASAGHTRGYVLDAAGEEKHVLPSTALPLGIAADTDFSVTATVQLAPGDSVLLLTDGILEARSPDGEPFGAERSLAILRHFQAQGAATVVQSLYHAVRAFVHNAVQLDDLTILVLKVTDQGGKHTLPPLTDTQVV